MCRHAGWPAAFLSPPLLGTLLAADLWIQNMLLKWSQSCSWQYVGLFVSGMLSLPPLLSQKHCSKEETSTYMPCHCFNKKKTRRSHRCGSSPQWPSLHVTRHIDHAEPLSLTIACSAGCSSQTGVFESDSSWNRRWWGRTPGASSVGGDVNVWFSWGWKVILKLNKRATIKAQLSSETWCRPPPDPWIWIFLKWNHYFCLSLMC